MSRKKISIPDQVLTALKRYQSTEKLADIYDDDDDLRSALIEAIPNFEYPNYSWMTVAQVEARLAASA